MCAAWLAERKASTQEVVLTSGPAQMGYAARSVEWSMRHPTSAGVKAAWCRSAAPAKKMHAMDADATFHRQSSIPRIAKTTFHVATE